MENLPGISEHQVPPNEQKDQLIQFIQDSMGEKQCLPLKPE